jgi:hypothetical protein
MPKRNLAGLQKLVSYCTLTLLIVIFSCNLQPSPVASVPTDSRSTKPNISSQEKYAPPIFIPLNANNAPVPIKPAKPVVRVDSSGVGIPFFTNYGTDQGCRLITSSAAQLTESGIYGLAVEERV